LARATAIPAADNPVYRLAPTAAIGFQANPADPMPAQPIDQPFASPGEKEPLAPAATRNATSK
jgi:hypothetical protein